MLIDQGHCGHTPSCLLQAVQSKSIGSSVVMAVAAPAEHRHGWLGLRFRVGVLFEKLCIRFHLFRRHARHTLKCCRRRARRARAERRKRRDALSNPRETTAAPAGQDGSVAPTSLLRGGLIPTPAGVDKVIGTRVATPVTFDVLEHDDNTDRAPFKVTTTSTPASGSVKVNPDGTLTYAPNSGFIGSDVFFYIIEDGSGGTDIAMVTVEVPAGPALPNGRPIPHQNDPDGRTITPVDVSASFIHSHSDVLIYSVVGLPRGLKVDRATGIITGTIETKANRSKSYRVIVTARDATGNMAAETFAWIVTNPPPDVT